MTTCLGKSCILGLLCVSFVNVYQFVCVLLSLLVLRLECWIWPRGYKTFFMLNSVEHEILNAHKYKNIKKFSFFQAHISLEWYFFLLLINVKMPTNGGILTLMSRKNFMLN